MHRLAPQLKEHHSVLISCTMNDAVPLFFPAASEDMGTTVNGDMFQVSRGGTDCLIFSHCVSIGGHLGLFSCHVGETRTEELFRLSSRVSGFSKEWHGIKDIRALPEQGPRVGADWTAHVPHL